LEDDQAGKLRLFPPKTSSKVVVVEINLERCNSSCDAVTTQKIDSVQEADASSQDGNRHQNDFTIGHPKEPNFSRFTFHFKDYFWRDHHALTHNITTVYSWKLFVQIEPSRSNQNRGHQKGSRYVSLKNR